MKKDLKIKRFRGSSWENVEPVEKHDGERVQQTKSTHGGIVCHKNSENIGVVCKSPIFFSSKKWWLKEKETLDLCYEKRRKGMKGKKMNGCAKRLGCDKGGKIGSVLIYYCNAKVRERVGLGFIERNEIR